MSDRHLVVLGTASQAPTRHRNHNGYVLRWDGEVILFDPGEGTQRQFTLAGVSSASVNRICITHFHGDHCLGLPGVIMRMALDNAPLPVPIHYPAAGQANFEHLRFASAGQEYVEVEPRPISESGLVARTDHFAITCARLTHRVESFGYRIEEPDGRRMVPERLAERGVVGADIGRLQREGTVEVAGRRITLDEVSEHRPGQVFAFVMDTAWCDAALELARDADLLVCEATFLQTEADLAAEYGHLTADQAGRLAADAGARRLVLSHFSQRYPEIEAFVEEAGQHLDDVIAAEDLLRVPVPDRR